MVGIWWLSNFSVFLQHISTAENLRGFGIVILWTQLTMIDDGILWVTNWGRTSSGVSGRGMSWQWLTMVAHCGLGMAGNGFMFNHQKCWKWSQQESAIFAERSSWQGAECRDIAAKNVRQGQRRAERKDSETLWMPWSLSLACNAKST